MSNINYFKIVHAILTELYTALQSGREVDFQSISALYFGVPESYVSEIWLNLLEKGFVRGFTYREAGKNIYFTGLSNVRITMDGVEYLEYNSTMRKLGEELWEQRSWIPGE